MKLSLHILSKTSIAGLHITLFILLLGSASAAATQHAPHAVIFMYHRFGESGYPSTNVTIEQFEQQLKYLKENNFSVLPLKDIVEALHLKTSLPDKTVAITVDDAYRSVYEVAYPRLQAFGFPFTVFVATGAVDNGNPAYMNWQQIREMHEHGVTFANHTVHHEHLIRKNPGESTTGWKERITAGIERAQQRLNAELDSAPMLFAYPYGEYNTELMAVIDELGYTAFGQHSGAAGGNSNRSALPRYPIAEAYAEMESFRTKAMSLPLPVLKQEPLDPQTNDPRPELRITLADADINPHQLTCYFHSKPMEIKWLEEARQFSIRSSEPLPPGRSRYNCTAPLTRGGRYHWFSHQWIVPDTSRKDT